MGNGFRIDLDRFSAGKIESDSILKDFHHSGILLVQSGRAESGRDPS